LKPLPEYRRVEGAETRHVAAGLREAPNKAQPDGIGDEHENDRYCARLLPQRHCRRRVACQKYVRRQADQFRGIGKSIRTGYLLANITDVEKRTGANGIWRQRIQSPGELGKDEDADGIKSWLRSQFAETIRERKPGASPEDIELIATEFHRWVHNNETRLGLGASSDFARFIERDFAFYSRWYERLRRAAVAMTPGLECVHFNAQHNFTLQYPVLLAPLKLDDDETSSLRKLRVAAAYLDILINRRIWNWRAFDYSTMQYAMFLTMRDIRGKSATDLAALLRERLDAETETFAPNDRNGPLWPAWNERPPDPSPAGADERLCRRQQLTTNSA
jgi:hypothetical protein